MCSRFPSALGALALAAAGPATGGGMGGDATTSAPRELRVCADPDNRPLSHADGSGLENRIARVLADELRATLRYAWLPDRRGFVRKTLGAGLCDAIVGVPAGWGAVLTTRPYYRSGYVFVQRAAEAPIASFDDPRLRRWRIGVQLVGDDLAATPPGHALARHGAIDNVTGFTVAGTGSVAERMTAAIATGQLDAGVLWGPLAGLPARQAAVPLAVVPARAPLDLAGLPFEFDIAVGVRKGDRALRDEIDAALARRRTDIDAILARYAVPRTDEAGPAPTAGSQLPREAR